MTSSLSTPLNYVIFSIILSKSLPNGMSRLVSKQVICKLCQLMFSATSLAVYRESIRRSWTYFWDLLSQIGNLALPSEATALFCCFSVVVVDVAAGAVLASIFFFSVSSLFFLINQSKTSFVPAHLSNFNRNEWLYKSQKQTIYSTAFFRRIKPVSEHIRLCLHDKWSVAYVLMKDPGAQHHGIPRTCHIYNVHSRVCLV